MGYKNKEDQYKWIKNKRKKVKEKAVKYLGNKCKLCEYKTCIQALEFHHINPDEKEFKPSNMGTYSWKKIKKELDKCVLWANYHREVHYNIRSLSND